MGGVCGREATVSAGSGREGCQGFVRKWGRVFGGLRDGSLLEWDASTLEARRRLRCEGKVGAVYCMTACGDLVISGHYHDDYCLQVWNTATGGCDHVLRGHTDYVFCVA